MAAVNQTPLQKRAVEAIMAKMQSYLDMRFQQIRRINSKVDAIWDDLTWQQLSQLRTSLSGDKGFGPQRFHVGELFLSDDQRRIRELLSVKSQNSLLGEIVEEKEKDTHRTGGGLEVHDMRTLFHAIDPGLDKMIGLVQTFIWWDLEDAVDLARFEKKVGIVRAFEENGITDEMADYYRELIGVDKKPSAEEVILHECRMLARTLELFRLRRNSEHGYQMIVKREMQAAENPDVIIEATANQMGMLRALRGGKELDSVLKEQFAKALGCEPSAVTTERATSFLDSTVQANKKRLRTGLMGSGSGQPYNVKRAQLEEMEKRFEETVRDRRVEESLNIPTPAIT
ncbi:hypothetical protein IT570_03935 [Candidatus Sumerlaeota bacterium]|nr:hypothetical protein [Candidatus Sumerlaeota bacterium]